MLVRDGYCSENLINGFFAQQLLFTELSGWQNNRMTNNHYHDCYEVYYLLDGKMSYLVEGKKYEMEKHDMIFIKKYYLHMTEYNTKDIYNRVILLFDDSIFDTLNNSEVINDIMSLFELRKISFPKEFSKYITGKIVDDILPAYTVTDEISRTKNATSYLKAKLNFYEIVLSILELYKEGKLIIGNNQMENQKEKIVYEIVNYINHNYYNNITLDLLSKNFFISKYYLCRIFKEITGLNVVEYVNKKRLLEAEILMKYSKLNITEISEKVGFNSVNHFIKLFKKEYDYTPKAFQEMMITG